MFDRSEPFSIATLGWLLVGLVVTGLVLYRVRAPRRRWKALTALAAEHGWQLREHDPSLVRRWPEHPFGKGEDRRAQDVLTGAYRGRAILVFQYSYEAPSRDSEDHGTTTTRFAVCTVRLRAPLPDVSVDPATFLYLVARRVGLPAIRFANEEFDRAFAVHAAEPKFAHELMHPAMMELLLRRDRVAWWIHGDDLLCWWPGSYDPATVVGRLDLLIDISEAIPPSVWSDRPHG
jgi:hypothetical protein